MSATTPRFCGLCAGPLCEGWVESDQRSRALCSHCGAIAYRNPQLVVSAIVAAGERVLLCRRAQPPAAGRWALPGGFLECGETLEEAAARETFEETGVRLSPDALRLHALSSLPEIAEVYVGFLALLAEPADLVCGPECSDVRFFDEATLPWAELTYPEVAAYLRLYFRERRERQHGVHLCRIDSSGSARNTYEITRIEAVRTPRAELERVQFRSASWPWK